MALTFVSRQEGTPIELSSPTRSTTAAPQAHTAGNLLVACITHLLDTVDHITNTAGDTWVKTSGTPYTPGARVQEIWYCLSTIGNAADVITVFFTAGTANRIGITIYEFNTSSGTWKYQSPDGSGFSLLGPTGLITTGTLNITQSSVIVALYATSGNTTPTASSGVQLEMHTDIAEPTVHWDSYQLTSVSGTAHATVPSTQPSWSILAAVFTSGVGPFKVGGLYFINFGKTNDTVYSSIDSSVPPNVVANVVAIPTPFFDQ